jgi:hypothetical protein
LINKKYQLRIREKNNNQKNEDQIDIKIKLNQILRDEIEEKNNKKGI